MEISSEKLILLVAVIADQVTWIDFTNNSNINTVSNLLNMLWTD